MVKQNHPLTLKLQSTKVAINAKSFDTIDEICCLLRSSLHL